MERAIKVLFVAVFTSPLFIGLVWLIRQSTDATLIVGIGLALGFAAGDAHTDWRRERKEHHTHA